MDPVPSSRSASKIVKPGRRVRMTRADKIVPATVAAGAPAVSSRMAARFVRSSYRNGRWSSRSRAVTMPASTRSRAVRGETPGSRPTGSKGETAMGALAP
jgi:hypothetical protein